MWVVGGGGCDGAVVAAMREKVLNLREHGFERAFIILTGAGGEDGVVQAALELQGIAYTGSGVAASAIKMDKVAVKRLWLAEKLPTADFCVLENEADANAAAKALGYPFVIKPSSEGSSVGVTIVKTPAQVAPAFKLARGSGRAVMAERFIKGAEMTVAVLSGEALPSIRIEPDGEFYDYHAKYISNATKYQCPTGLPKAQDKAPREPAVQTFALVGTQGWGRGG